MELRPKHLRAVALLTETDLCRSRVAALIGVAPRTLRRWLKDTAFCEELARRRRLQPHRLDALRIEAAEQALVDVIGRFQAEDVKPPVREVTQLLDRLVGDDFRRARLAQPENRQLTQTTWGSDLVRDYDRRLRRRKALRRKARSAIRA